MASCVALIPARGGSKRIPGKNVRRLAGHPLLAYTVAGALESGVFDAVIGSTGDEEIARILRHYGCDVPFLRKPEFEGDVSPDIEWLSFTLSTLAASGRRFDCFSILRPTSPFRQAATIRRAWERFLSLGDRIDSLRAVEPCEQHPGKMWVVEGDLMRPFVSAPTGERPWHSRPYQDLPRVYAQNASLEIAWTRVALDDHSIAGSRIAPFFSEGVEGFDINQPHDWIVAEHLIRTGGAILPPIRVPACEGPL